VRVQLATLPLPVEDVPFPALLVLQILQLGITSMEER
jgi:hypothetical protein